MKKIISISVALLLLSMSVLVFAAFEQVDTSETYINEKARLLKVDTDGVVITWKWSKGVEWSGLAQPNEADWSHIPMYTPVLFNYNSAPEDAYLHLNKTFYLINDTDNFHIRYLGDDPIGDEIDYMIICNWKFSKEKGQLLQDFWVEDQLWKVFYAEKEVYQLTETEPDVWEYVYLRSEVIDHWDMVPFEEPFGFGNL